MEILKIDNIYKSFGSHDVIRGLSLNIPEKTIVGFLGKNGAGKTTTMKMILGFLKIDRGTIEVFGEKVKYGQTNTNRHIGYLPDVPAFYEYMTAMEYLSLCGSITGLTKKETLNKSEELLALVGLNQTKKKISCFSRGMKQRLGIVQALLNSPKLLICDEPTSALDPIGRREILDIMDRIKEKTTILFSTHILSDVEAICKHVVILNEGKNALSGSIDSLKRMERTHEIMIRFKSVDELNKFKGIDTISKSTVIQKENILSFTSKNFEYDKKNILYELYNANIFPLELSLKEPSLESIFMEVTKS